MRAPSLHPSRPLAALSGLCIALSARAETQTQRLAADAIRRLDLQADLPRATPPLWPDWQPHLSLPSGVKILVLLLALGALAYLFIRYARGDLLSVWRRAAVAPGEATQSETAGPSTPGEAMATADELARQGRFVEAMHLLLLRSLADIRPRLDTRFADSLTSREILRSPSLPESGRAPLREIVARVEWTYFGEHPAAAADYADCRIRFAELALALHGDARR